MRAILEVLLSLLAVAGLLGLGWLLFGHILTPAGGGSVCAVVPGTGDGETLEHAVAGLLWLRGGGLMKGTILIADCGLTAEGKAVATVLTLREPGVEVCPADRLPERVRREAGGGH